MAFIEALLIFSFASTLIAAHGHFDRRAGSANTRQTLVFYREPERSLLAGFQEGQQDVAIAAGEVMNELKGFGDNFHVFNEKFGLLFDEFSRDILLALNPVYAALPAQVFKEFVLHSMKSFLNVLDKVGKIFKENNPLHPSHPSEVADVRSLIRRELTTLSSFGVALANLSDALDNLAVKSINGFVKGLQIQAHQWREAVKRLESTPAEFVKQVVTQLSREISLKMENHLKKNKEENQP